MVVTLTDPAAESVDTKFTKAGLKLFSFTFDATDFNDASVIVDGATLIHALQAAGGLTGKITQLEINYYGTINATVKIAFTDGSGRTHYVGRISCIFANDHYAPDTFDLQLHLLLHSKEQLDWGSMFALVNAGYAAGDDMTITVRGEIYQ